MASVKKSNKKKDTKITSGVLRVTTTQNNTLVVLTDNEGNKILWGGTWLMGYKWAKKDTPYAAEMLTKSILKEAQGYGLKEMWLIIRWIGMARDGVFKAINEIWLVDLLYIKECTPIQFGWVKGIRPKRN